MCIFVLPFWKYTINCETQICPNILDQISIWNTTAKLSVLSINSIILTSFSPFLFLPRIQTLKSLHEFACLLCDTCQLQGLYLDEMNHYCLSPGDYLPLSLKLFIFWGWILEHTAGIILCYQWRKLSFPVGRNINPYSLSPKSVCLPLESALPYFSQLSLQRTNNFSSTWEEKVFFADLFLSLYIYICIFGFPESIKIFLIAWALIL